MRIYLDHSATTPCDSGVYESMVPYFGEFFGNADSQHGRGRDTAKAVSTARADIARLLGCKSGELYFTSSGTESDNWAIKGSAWARRDRGNHIIISNIEHHAVLSAAEWLENNGFVVTKLPVNSSGIVEPQTLADAIREDTILVSVMYVNNEVGSVQPIKELCDIAHKHKVLFHTDCVQATPYMHINLTELGVDMATISAHKFYGPKGVGALYVRNGVRIDKLIHGGGQERSRRGGTTNTPAIVGMAHALQLAVEGIDSNNAHIASVRDHFANRVLSEIPYVFMNGDREHMIPSVANITFQFIEGEGILMFLDFAGIEVSSGSACSSGSLEPSHVLLAMGVPIEYSHGSIRFSFGKDNTIEEADYVVDKLKNAVETLRNMSPLFQLNKGDITNV